ncbi:nitroreductase/quinone reductase family protein [Amycolatopsis sp. NPDC021455]|uniref:nitroreductase/quinone reductase family protein n=1 Tax=Amycolatopsis sp. NPDC021455 TaxID=3154901 RepID=UPI003404C4A2
MTDSVVTGQDLLIDRFLPRFDVTLTEHVVADAGLAETWQAVRDLDLMRVRSPLTHLAVFARNTPAQLKPFAGDTALPGWLRLGETPGREVVLGAVGRFWQPGAEWYDVRAMTPAGFAAFTEPDWGRITAAISVRPYGLSRTLVTCEARTATTDPVSARRFARYWWLVRPFVRFVMQATLRTIRDDAASLADGRHTTSDGAVGRWARRHYRGARPHGVARVLNHGDALAFAAGLLPKRGVTLEVPGRLTGWPVRVPLVVADHEGERYLVAMLGDRTQWVRNVRAAGGHVVLRHGRREAVRLEELAPAERPPVLRRYLAVAPGARAHIAVDRHAPLEEFARIAADLPVFRIVPEDAGT